MKEFSFLRTKIGRRFLTAFLAISLIPPATIGWIAIHESKNAIEQQNFALLRAASDGAEAQLREFLSHLKQRLVYASQEERVREALHGSVSLPANSGSSKMLEMLSSGLAVRHQSMPDVLEVLVLTSAGKVLASSSADSMGRDFSSSAFFLQGSKSFFAGDIVAEPGTGRPVWIMASPVYDETTRQFLGVMAFRIDPDSLSRLTTGRRVLSEGANTQSFRIGESGETYIVNQSGLMITESRYVLDSVLKTKVNTEPVRVWLDRGHEISSEYIDYRGTRVSGASAVFQGPPWILITEVDFSQSFAPVRILQRELWIWTMCLILFAILLSWICTRRVLKPIRLLQEADRAMAKRDESAALVPESALPDDEIGQLVRQRNVRVKTVFQYQRQLEERTAKLQETVAELEHISYAIVHDMRAPLRAMQGFANLLETEGAGYTLEERKSYLRRIDTAAVRLDHLIRDVLTYNEAVLRHVSLHPVDLHSLLRGILDTYPQFDPAKANISIAGTLPVVIGNEALLTQCFSNLLENSVKFVAPGTKPQIRIRTEPAGMRVTSFGQAQSASGNLLASNPPDFPPSSDAAKTSAQFVRIWIEDNGIGIPKHAQPEIFRMFQRVTHDHEGTGVGLAVVHKSIQRIGGKIGLESEPGEGSRFWIELALA